MSYNSCRFLFRNRGVCSLNSWDALTLKTELGLGRTEEAMTLADSSISIVVIAAIKVQLLLEEKPKYLWHPCHHCPIQPGRLG